MIHIWSHRFLFGTLPHSTSPLTLLRLYSTHISASLISLSLPLPLTLFRLYSTHISPSRLSLSTSDSREILFYAYLCISFLSLSLPLPLFRLYSTHISASLLSFSLCLSLFLTLLYTCLCISSLSLSLSIPLPLFRPYSHISLHLVSLSHSLFLSFSPAI